MFKELEVLSDLQSRKLNKLRKFLKKLENACIAYSGGVDSSLVATIAFEQLGSKSLAITGVSPALANTLLLEARMQAKWLGIHHQEIETSELEQKDLHAKKNCINTLHIYPKS